MQMARGERFRLGEASHEGFEPSVGERLGGQQENQIATSLRVHYVPLRSQPSPASLRLLLLTHSAHGRLKDNSSGDRRPFVCSFVEHRPSMLFSPFTGSLRRFAPLRVLSGTKADRQAGIFYGSFEGNPAMTSRLWEFAEQDRAGPHPLISVGAFVFPPTSPEGLSERKQCRPCPAPPKLVFQQNGQTSTDRGDGSGNAVKTLFPKRNIGQQGASLRLSKMSDYQTRWMRFRGQGRLPPDPETRRDSFTKKKQKTCPLHRRTSLHRSPRQDVLEKHRCIVCKKDVHLVF